MLLFAVDNKVYYFDDSFGFIELLSVTDDKILSLFRSHNSMCFALITHKRKVITCMMKQDDVERPIVIHKQVIKTKYTPIACYVGCVREDDDDYIECDVIYKEGIQYNLISPTGEKKSSLKSYRSILNSDRKLYLESIIYLFCHQMILLIEGDNQIEFFRSIHNHSELNRKEVEDFIDQYDNHKSVSQGNAVKIIELYGVAFSLLPHKTLVAPKYNISIRDVDDFYVSGESRDVACYYITNGMMFISNEHGDKQLDISHIPQDKIIFPVNHDNDLKMNTRQTKSAKR